MAWESSPAGFLCSLANGSTELAVPVKLARTWPSGMATLVPSAVAVLIDAGTTESPAEDPPAAALVLVDPVPPVALFPAA
jgi:hypothetical protein